ncbi:hypothetical protein [Massilia sp. X63]|uniref:hypothetical protein n=1 Tax=Massilia sp. X63 TaxID=3237285 RepID=UPI0034DD88D2
MNELLSSNFSRQDVRLSNADPTGMTDSQTGVSSVNTDADDDGRGIGASIKNFFTDLFGADNSEHASRYEGAVTRGHHVLTVSADSLPEVERAADIVERYGPTDIDEQASGAGAMAGGMSAGLSDSMRASGAGGMQQTSGMAMQSGAGVNQQLDNPGDRKLFAQQSLNQAEPMGQTYQEPMGKSGLSATGGTSLQGATLQENALQSSSLDGTADDDAARSAGLQGANAGSMQRDTAIGNMHATSSAMHAVQIQRGRSRIYSRDGVVAGSSRSGGLDIGSNFFGDDDDYYRNHFLANYSDDDYERVKPAYAYGAEMARSGKYSGRQWDQVESDLRSGWDTRSSGGPSTWEKMKAAVRHGWERMTSDDDDSYYRSHYDSNLSSSGLDYGSVKPAYSYGTEMRKSELYRNRPWDDIEGDMRKGWDSRISTATHGDTSAGAWERMKSAVRHGWDRVTDDDDREYRSHWNATYSTVSDAGSYDDYKPAYAYGSSMAQDPKYRGRQWGEVENDLRTDWDTRYGSGGQSTWEKMKSAVRHGWNRMTS